MKDDRNGWGALAPGPPVYYAYDIYYVSIEVVLILLCLSNLVTLVVFCLGSYYWGGELQIPL